ncbi:M48 family metalloprotease [Thermoleophilia bacterium SCSIO 60948]|nr:M48 family metalloprotease [Thermoleophilia bacterium SCSIO 60948]
MRRPRTDRPAPGSESSPAPGSRAPSALAILAAGLAALAISVLAVVAFAPSPTPVEPARVDPASILDGPRLEQARDLRGQGRLLYAIGLALQIALLATLAAGRPRFIARRLERLASRPALGSMLTGFLLWVALSLVTLPTSLIARSNAVEAGISTQSLGSWLSDWALSTAIWGLMAALALGLLAALWRRLGRLWWVAATVAVVAISAAYVWLSPILIGPAFNDYTEIPRDDPVRADVERLADEAGVDVGEVLAVDSSRRTTTVNAYVGGLGPTKRVVVYDTLLDDGERRELRSVLAHELGHVVGEDLLGGLGFIAVVAPLGLLFASLAATRLAARRGLAPGSPAALPGLVLAIGVAVTVLGVPGNVLSREVEAGADTYALELTDDPQALISLQRRFARTNLSEPDPPAVWGFLFSTHPSPVERVGAAVAWKRGERPD